MDNACYRLHLSPSCAATHEDAHPARYCNRPATGQQRSTLHPPPMSPFRRPRYHNISHRHEVDGVNAYERWRELTRGLPPAAVTLCDVWDPGPGYCDDMAELRRSRVLLHVKVGRRGRDVRMACVEDTTCVEDTRPVDRHAHPRPHRIDRKRPPPATPLPLGHVCGSQGPRPSHSPPRAVLGPRVQRGRQGPCPGRAGGHGASRGGRPTGLAAACG